MQLSYTWLNSFVGKNLQWGTIHEFSKTEGSPLKQLNKDEMNGIERLHIQLSYSWLNSSVGKKSRKYNGRERFEIPIAHFLHFVKMLNW